MTDPPNAGPPDGDFDLEAAYRRALEAVDATDLPDGFGDAEPEADADSETGPGTGDLLPFPQSIAGAQENREPSAVPVPQPAGSAATGSAAADTAPRVTPQAVVEAALFVGGIELTAERLAGLLRGEATPESVARLIDGLNRRYDAERRPYEILREDGSYRLAVREEFEPLRRRVYGVAPKEVKLSQEAIETLALVAYRQPVSRERAVELKGPGVAAVLRQLVRRGLIAEQTTADGKGQAGGEGQPAGYVTTPRFLDLFGIAALAELPRAEDLNFK